MNKNTDIAKPSNDDNTTAAETIETVELETVTGGCSRCGCGQPDALGTQNQFLTNWRR